MLEVCLLGTGGMMPLPRRALTSLMTRLNGSSLLIDCGEGTQVAVKDKGWSMHDIDTICLTHLHGDHVIGLPGLLLSMGNAERTEPLLIVGPKDTKKIVSSLLTVAPGLPFSIEVMELTQPEQIIKRNEYVITAVRVKHNVVCYGYSIEVKRAGRFVPDMAAENNVPMKFWNALQKGKVIEDEGRRFTPDMVLTKPRKGIKLVYCTDSRPATQIVDMAKDADLFICEGMYGEKDKQKKAVEYRHMTFYEAAQMAKDANVKEMWLTHYSPSLIRPEEFMDEVRKIFPRAKAGKDRMSVDLAYEDDE